MSLISLFQCFEKIAVLVLIYYSYSKCSCGIMKNTAKWAK